MIKTVSIIGAGSMGSRMASRLLDAGYPLHVCDRDADVIARLRMRGAQVAAQPVDCAHTDAVIVMVANDDQLLSVLLGEGGLAGALDGTRQPLVIIMGTVLPATVKHVASTLGQGRVRLLDAPVSGGPAGAYDGTLTVMVGGDPADLEEARELLAHLSRHVFYCGPLGAGAAVKIVNNFLGVTMIHMATEAYTLAARYGVEPEHLAPVLDESSGRNFMSRDIAHTSEQYRIWSESDASFRSICQILDKDLTLAAQLACDVGLTLPMLAGVHATVTGLDAVSPEVLSRWRELGKAT